MKTVTINLYKNIEGVIVQSLPDRACCIHFMHRWEISTDMQLYIKSNAQNTSFEDVYEYIKYYNEELEILTSRKDVTGNTWKQRRKRFNRRFDKQINDLNSKYGPALLKWMKKNTKKIGTCTIKVHGNLSDHKMRRVISSVLTVINLHGHDFSHINYLREINIEN